MYNSKTYMGRVINGADRWWSIPDPFNKMVSGYRSLTGKRIKNYAPNAYNSCGFGSDQGQNPLHCQAYLQNKLEQWIGSGIINTLKMHPLFGWINHNILHYNLTTKTKSCNKYKNNTKTKYLIINTSQKTHCKFTIHNLMFYIRNSLTPNLLRNTI